jgi:uridine monophosphate synthetase
METSDIVHKLYDKGVIKLGAFTSKNDFTVPLQIDLRQAIAYPQLLQALSQMVWSKVKHLKDSIDVLCGIPETTLAIAHHLAPQLNKRALMIRKGHKVYGKKWVEGPYRLGEISLLLEEAISTGNSALATIKRLREVGLAVPYVITFLERDLGARAALDKIDCQLFHIFTQAELLQQLKTCGVAIPEEAYVE